MAILDQGTHSKWESPVMHAQSTHFPATHSSYMLENFELLSYRFLALALLAFSFTTMESMYLHIPSSGPLIIAIR